MSLSLALVREAPRRQLEPHDRQQKPDVVVACGEQLSSPAGKFSVTSALERAHGLKMPSLSGARRAPLAGPPGTIKMDASLVHSPLRPRHLWFLLAGAATLPGCPPTDDYFLSQTQPSSTNAGTGGQPPIPGANAECGNGIAEAAEGCDGADLRGASCELLGLGAGTLRCMDCKLDVAACTAKAPVCGDGVADPAGTCSFT